MDLTVIGHWAPFPRTGESCSGYLLKYQNTSILLDCGHSVFSSLGKYFDYKQLNGVIISHFHPDHFADLYALRHAMGAALKAGQRKTPLDVFMPDEPEADFQYWKKVQEFNLIPIKNGTVQWRDFCLDFYPMSHSLPTFAARITGDACLFYTADTRLVEENIDLAEEVDLMLAEASFLEMEAEAAHQLGHMTAVEAGYWAEMSSAPVLIATHLWPGYAVEDIRKQARKFYCGDLIVASAGLQITF